MKYVMFEPTATIAESTCTSFRGRYQPIDRPPSDRQPLHIRPTARARRARGFAGEGTRLPGMDADTLLTFVRYHAWENDSILKTTAELSDEELRRLAVLDHGSAFDTLLH